MILFNRLFYVFLIIGFLPVNAQNYKEKQKQLEAKKISGKSN
jgi:hypothetical protein